MGGRYCTIRRAILIGLLLLGVGVVPYGAWGASNVTGDGPTASRAVGSTAWDANTTKASDPTITGIAVAERAERASGTAYVWQSAGNGSADGYHVTVALESVPSGEYSLCLAVGGNKTCKVVSTGTDGSVVFANVAAGNASSGGELKVLAVLQNASSGATVDARSLTLVPVTRDGDLDGDGLANARESEIGTSLAEPDVDGDGVADGTEVHEYGSDPTVVDTDGDGVPDGTEVRIGTTPTAVDTDRDGLVDGRERDHGTDPTTADTDGDGLDDPAELGGPTDPTDADTDDDGLADGAEADGPTDPLDADTDGDGYGDGAEAESRTDPVDADTDDDGLADGKEVVLGTTPIRADSDGDGIVDGVEVHDGTNPFATDTDGDYLPDGFERRLDVDPTDSLTPARFTSVALGFLVGVGATVIAINRGWVISLRRTLDVKLFGVGPFVDVDDGADTSGTADARPPEQPTGEAAVDGTGDGPDAGFDTELLTDEEVVLRLLGAEDGKMRQTAIVEATEWSKAKVSRLLSGMDEDDEIVKVRLGRENLICLESAVPERAGSLGANSPPTPARSTASPGGG